MATETMLFRSLKEGGKYFMNKKKNFFANLSPFVHIPSRTKLYPKKTIILILFQEFQIRFDDVK